MYFPSSAYADDQELKLKTAYLVNIAKFVTWPENNSKITLCLSDNSSLHEFVSDLDGYLLGSERMLYIQTNPPDLDSCHMIFVDTGFDNQRLMQIRSHQSESLLIISDIKGALDKGDDVQMFVRDLKLRIAINESTISHSSFSISSKLLRIARKLN
ncbi:MAG: YfiR family protein [Flavobacteriales bacterium]|nr:YfiR family protein [Flavobacteriales bacterium]